MVPFLNLQVGDVMTRDPVTIAPTARLAEARELFEGRNYNALPVLDGGELAGLLTQFDFLRAFLFTPESIIPRYDEILGRPVREHMVTEVDVAAPSESLNRVLTRMIETRNKSFPVLDSGRLVGMIARRDVMRGLHEDVRRG